MHKASKKFRQQTKRLPKVASPTGKFERVITLFLIALDEEKKTFCHAIIIRISSVKLSQL